MTASEFLSDAIPFGNGIDQRAVLFKKGNLVVRQIKQEHAPFYRELIDSDIGKSLIAKRLLLDTRTIPYVDDSSGLLLEQNQVSPVTYIHEWTKSMVLSAAESCLSLHRTLVNQGYCLCDSHPWNTLFDSDPKWVDITSIRRFHPRTCESSLVQFEKTYLSLLQLLETELCSTARIAIAHAFHDFDLRFIRFFGSSGKPERLWRRLLEQAVSAQTGMLRNMLKEVNQTRRNRRPISDTASAIKRIVNLQSKLGQFRSPARAGIWSQYSQAGLGKITYQEAKSGVPSSTRMENLKFSAIYRILKDQLKSGATLLDLASSRGIYSLFGAKIGYKVIATDNDEGALEELCAEVALHKIPVTVILNDFVAPLEPSGMASNPFPSFYQRIASDGVMCLALMHHLCLGKYCLSFENLTKLLASVCNRFLILEFIPENDPYLLHTYGDQVPHAAYSRENLRRSLESCFRFETFYPSFPEGREVWLLKKSDSRSVSD